MEFKNSKSSLGGEILNLNLNENINSKDINLIKNFVDERLVVLIRNQEIDDYKLKLDKSKVYHIYCAGGYRSMIACSILKKNGFKSVVDISGGFSKIKTSKPEIINV